VFLRLHLGALVAAGALATSGPALAQAPVAIEHQDVACIVAGQFPLLDACFRPGPGLAKARVYFRPEGIPNWYYVEATGPAPPRVGDPPDLMCRRATLPKPKKSLVNTHVEYYLEATGRRMETSQTETFRPLVVEDEGECENRLLAAFIPNATVAVFPALPAGFALGGGLSAAAVAAVVGAGVAGTTGVVVAATSGGDDTPATTQPAVTPTTQAPATTVPPTTATTTLPPAAAFNPVFKVFKGGVLEPSVTITGLEPLQLRFFMCETTGPLPLNFNVLVNGAVATAGCDSTITFSVGGFAPGFGAVRGAGVRRSALPTSYDVVMRIQSDGPGNEPKASMNLQVTVDSTPSPTTTTTMPPATTTTTTSTTSTTSSTTTTTSSTLCAAPSGVGLASPKTGEVFVAAPQYPISFNSFGTDVARVEYWLRIGTVSDTMVADGPPSAPFSAAWRVGDADAFFASHALGCGPVPTKAYAVFFSSCGASTVSTPEVDIFVGDPNPGRCPLPPTSFLANPPSQTAGPTLEDPTGNRRFWVSQLEVSGGRGQVVVNAREASFPAAGRVALASQMVRGENRVEAMLVQSEGTPGLWRFELGDGFVPGSLRVVAGDVALVAAGAVVFRLKGQPGERVVFTFRSAR